MTPEKRAELIKHLASHGLSVLLTRDFDSMLIQLARLAQFERLLIQSSETNPWVRATLERIWNEQKMFVDNQNDIRRMEIIDVPTVLNSVNRALNDQLDQRAHINPEHLTAATAAFTAILCRR